MVLTKKSSGIDFYDLSVKKAWESTQKNDRELHKHLKRAFQDILDNAFCGVQFPKKLFPKEYKKFDNLWKYNLPGAWRLIYTVKSPTKTEIISVILDWSDHKNYERKFKF